MKKLIILNSILVLSACGGIKMIDANQQTIIEKQLPKIADKGGQLCICRANNFLAAVRSYDMTANKEFIGNLPNDSYFCVNLSPDEYLIAGDSGFGMPRVSAETTIKQGQRKYMEVQINTGTLSTTSSEVGLSCIAGTM